MQTKIKINMTVKDMFSFLLNNTYRKFTGIIWVAFSLVLIAVTIITWGDVKIINSILLIVLACMYTVVNPIMLYFKAKSQIKNNDYFKEELCYELNDEGITVTQGEAMAETKWEEIWKAVRMGRNVVVYVTNLRAFVWPVSCISEQYEEIYGIIRKNMNIRCKLKSRL